MAWFAQQYLPQSAHRTHPDVAPLRAQDLARLSPTLLITAEYDPLRDEGRSYAARLIEAGNDVTYIEWPGVVHGFWLLNAVTAATRDAIGTAAEWIRGRLARRPELLPTR